MSTDRELMIDSYNVITGISTFEELLETKDELAIVFNPYKPIKVMDGDAYDLLIDYFITTNINKVFSIIFSFYF